MRKRRRQRQPDKRLDWRDPGLPVLTRVLEPAPMGGYQKVAVDMPPDEMQSMCAGSMEDSPNPGWRDDPTYNWARPGARRRRL